MIRSTTYAGSTVLIVVSWALFALGAGGRVARESTSAQTKSTAEGKRPFIEERVIWDQQEGGISTHFVYGLVATKKGTILAFSEARITPGDHTPHHLALKRSEDSGRTWSDNIYIERSDGSFF